MDGYSKCLMYVVHVKILEKNAKKNFHNLI